MKTYTFHVSLPGAGRVWRKIEMRADQTLEDLHFAIQDAYDFDADHLYSFFMSGKAWDKDTEYCLPEGLDPYGFPIFDDAEEWDEGEDGDELAESEEIIAEARPRISPQEFAFTIMNLMKEGKSAEEIKAEALRLAGETAETISPQDAQALDNMLKLAQTLVDQVSIEDIEGFISEEANWGEPGDVRTTKLEDLNLKRKQEFMYLFDYGDEWRFKVRVHAIDPDAPDADYPLIVEEVGEAPPQYPAWDEEDDEEWDEEGWDDDLEGEEWEDADEF